MTDLEQRKVAKEFAERWKDKGYERGESQKFWIDLLENVLEIKNASTFINFEDTVHIDKATGFIDGFIPKTKVLIEQKSINRDLRKAIKQADGSLLNPFQQAKRYSAELPYDDRPRWIVTCNFKSFLIYDMNNSNGEPEEILLKDLSKEYYRLSFLVDTKNEHIKKEEELSFKAGELVGKLYDAFSKQYRDLENEQSQKDLNELCVRIVFCLYAEDAGLFGRKNVFHDYLDKYDDLTLMRENLIKLFKTLDTPLDKRDPYLEDELNQFPYVNGGLFSNENIEIPKFTEEIRNTLLAKASNDFDWSEISPTIFGAVFESTLNPETRRSGGMHYTSIENIHKVIDPLFLDELREKLNEAESYKNEKTRTEKLMEFQEYLGTLKFLDPACGSGNFLTETYLSLRRLENEALDTITHGMMIIDLGDIIKVSIQQFYGIEINDFAVKVARTALWIAEAQMWSETRNILAGNSKLTDFLPLETYNNIYEGNALRIDWNDVILNTECNYIMGNPPFVGHQVRNDKQIQDMNIVFSDFKNYGKLDYVACWYKKTCDYIKNEKIKCAFVSTNSICQGEQVYPLWYPLLIQKGIIINFAYRTFIWNSEANQKAHVHCVIIGFSKYNFNDKKIIFDDVNHYKYVENINGYLYGAPNIFIESRGKVRFAKFPEMTKGSQPTDGGNLLLTEDDKNDIIKNNAKMEKYIHQYIGAEEFINNKKRFCLWFINANPQDFINDRKIMEIISNVRDVRLKSPTPSVRDAAKTPTLFTEIRQPKSRYIVIPETSSENRRYIPIGFMDSNIICSNAIRIIPSSDIYLFGILTSNVHMAWMRALCGRLKSDYRYTPAIYNNFPWPNPTQSQKEKIEKTAQMILNARKDYSSSSLADMYGNMNLYNKLLIAHQLNDYAVWEAYGKKWDIKSESDCVAELMKMYQNLVNKEDK